MEAYSQEWLAPVERSKVNQPLGKLTNHWGFTIYQKASSRLDPSLILEAFAKLTGILIIPICGIIVFLPDPQTVPGGFLSQFGMLFAFMFVGIAIFVYAGRGFRDVVQVNTDRRELRLGTMNSAAKVHISEVIQADDIHSLFIQRSKSGAAPAKLLVRVRFGWNTKQLIEGPERQLSAILEEIARGFREPAKRNNRVITKRTERFICTRLT